MVVGFRRSFSLPISKCSPRHKSARPQPEKSFHARSTSIPCRSHPTVSKLEDDIRALRDWQSRSEPQSASPAWLLAGAAQLELLHDSIRSLLHLPQLHDSLRCGSSGWIERILDDFLRFADAHGVFRSAVADLKEHHSAARAAFRRRDEAQLASCIRAQKKVEKELFKLSSEIYEVPKSSPALAWPVSNAKEAELAGIMRQASTAIASASASIFLGIAAASATTSAVLSCSRSSWMVSPLRRMASNKSRSSGEDEEKEEAWRKSAAEKLQGLEDCIAALEAKNERVFRSLLNIRVALLNILTPSI